MRRTLFDQNVPRALSSLLPDCEVRRAAQEGWGELTNGDLLKAAETAGFSLFVSADQNIAYQQNMKGRHIALLVLSTNHWATLRASASNIIQAVERIGDAGYEFVECGLPLRVRRTPPTLKL